MPRYLFDQKQQRLRMSLSRRPACPGENLRVSDTGNVPSSLVDAVPLPPLCQPHRPLAQPGSAAAPGSVASYAKSTASDVSVPHSGTKKICANTSVNAPRPVRKLCSAETNIDMRRQPREGQIPAIRASRDDVDSCHGNRPPN